MRMLSKAAVLLAMCFLSSTFAHGASAQKSPKSQVVRKDAASDSAQVRVALTLKPHHIIQIRSPKGEVITQTKVGEELNFTLRAKINQANHFYFAGYHVESIPTVWRQEVREYGVKLNFYQASAINNDVEERIGSMNVTGHLVAHQDKTYNLIANTDSSFQNAQGQNLLSVRAGFALPGVQEEKAPLVSKAE